MEAVESCNQSPERARQFLAAGAVMPPVQPVGSQGSTGGVTVDTFGSGDDQGWPSPRPIDHGDQAPRG